MPVVAERRRLIALCAIMTVVALAVSGVAIGTLYRAEFDQERDRLVKLVDEQARFLGTIGGRADGAVDEAVLGAVRNSLSRDAGSNCAGRCMIFGRDGGTAQRLDSSAPNEAASAPVNWADWLPVREALAGKSGTVSVANPRGGNVLAAYGPVKTLGLGIVAEVSLSEIRAPFLRAAGFVTVFAFATIALGTYLFFAVGEPIVVRMREGEARFRELFENLKSGAAVYDPIDDGHDFICRDINRGSERIDAVSRDEVIGRRLTEVFPGVERFGLLEVLRRVWKTGRPEHFPAGYYEDDRIAGWRDSYVYRLPSGEVVALYDDVTEQKNAERRLRDSEERWRSIIALQADATVIVDSENRILYMNEAAEALFGQASEKLVGEAFGFPVAVGDVAEIEIVRPGGSVAYAEMQVIPMQSHGEDQFVLFIRDVSTHRRTEGDLRKLFQAIEQSPVSVVITDVGGRIEYVNPKFTQATGYTYPEVVGKNPRILKSGYTSGGDYARLWETISRGKVWRGEFHNRTKKGDYFWELASIAPVRDVRGRVTHYVAVKEDITDRKATEERLREAAKMKAVGELTGGIAHDFNNLLAIILGNLQLLEESVPKDDENSSLIADAIWSAERGAELTSRLLAFARRQYLNPRSADINHVIRRMTDLLRRTLGEGIEIHEILAPDLWNALIDRGQLESALLNLVVNSRDAMPDGGTLTISTENIAGRWERKDVENGPKEGDAVLVTVRDTGVGMEPEVADRIFEPFFTTKQFGKGSGLGLSMVYGFVNQSGGEITVESALGHGTTMRLYLPRAKADADPEGPTKPARQNDVAGEAVILVVEDDERVRSTATRVLRAEGYQVLEARNARDALEVLDSIPRLDLLFSDVVLPDGVNGPELARIVLQRRPESRLLLTSGYAAQEPGGDSAAGLKYPFLAKPYRREVLIATVREALNEAGGSPLPG